MTSLYYDTNLGCDETYVTEWDRADEGYVSLLTRIKNMFR